MVTDQDLVYYCGYQPLWPTYNYCSLWWSSLNLADTLLHGNKIFNLNSYSLQFTSHGHVIYSQATVTLVEDP